MQIATKTVTTRVHQAVASTDELKRVAITAVKKQLGIGDDGVVSSSAELQPDGSIGVEVVEAVADAPATDVAATQTAAQPPVSQPVI